MHFGQDLVLPARKSASPSARDAPLASMTTAAAGRRRLAPPLVRAPKTRRQLERRARCRAAVRTQPRRRSVRGQKRSMRSGRGGVVPRPRRDGLRSSAMRHGSLRRISSWHPMLDPGGASPLERRALAAR
jgi:hypothetical protein